MAGLDRWNMTGSASMTAAATEAMTVKLIANFLRQLAGTSWSGRELAALADEVEAGRRMVVYDPDYSGPN